ncbi:MAG: ribonuclease R [Coriobacteriales bacterium]|jgi:ribonuclease R
MGKKKASRRRRYGRSGRRSNRSVGSLPTGIIRITSEGFGFVESSEGKFFIPSDKIHGAMDGDMVRVRPRSSSWRYEVENSRASSRGDQHAPIAVVDRVLDRATSRIVGVYVVYDGIGYIIPQDKRMDYLIRAYPRRGLDVEEGEVVLLTIETYPTRHETPSGLIEEVIGHSGDPGLLEEIIAAKHGLETKFSEAALGEAKSLALDVEGVLREQDRRDVRDRFTLTIDPADARDFDDALSVDYVNGTMRLGVHIADVSNYVKWGSSIDLDARRRSTSTYFPDRVIPMLPEELSNGLCSLNPGEDRLSFTVDIMLDENCAPIGREMYPSVMRSSLRLDYDSVQKMFEGEMDYPSEEAKRTLQALRKIGGKLRARRMKRGALDFESTELKVTFDGDGKPDGIVKRSRSEATNLVEEAMILANETVAEYMLSCDAPMVYRVHDNPDPRRIDEVVPILKQFGLASEGAPLSNFQIQEVLDEVRGKPTEELVSMLLLRAMKQAVYRDVFTTHFGLASSGYTHFTSPIRRYPDLMAHRLLRLRLIEDLRAEGRYTGPLPDAVSNLDTMIDQLGWLCENCSVKERDAEKASYDALESKICEYMQQFIGEEFTAMIVNVLRFGFFVRLKNGCEGLVPIRGIDGRYEYDERMRTLTEVGGGSLKSFRMGQKLKVVLIESDPRKGQLTFKLAKQPQ